MRIDRNAVTTADTALHRCRRHDSPAPAVAGVCAGCLRDRLLRLCPDCAHIRPCGCTSSSSSSSFSSSSTDLVSGSCKGIGIGPAGIGAVGSVGDLIGSEPAFRRSRSAGAPLKPAFPAPEATPPPERPIWRRAAAYWGFWRPEAKMGRSRSVAGGGGEGGFPARVGWRFYFGSPVKAFRGRRAVFRRD